MLPLSRYIATRLVLSSGAVESLDPRGDRADAKAVRLLLVLLSRAASRDTDEDAWRDAVLEWQQSGLRPHESVDVGIRGLRADLGGALLETIVRSYGKATHLLATVAGLDGFGFVRPFDTGVRDAATERQIGPTTKALRIPIEATLAAMAHPHADATDDGTPPPFALDAKAMALFTSRYSPLLYARTRAWFDPHTTLPKAWRPRRARNGDLMLNVPVSEAQAALGVAGLRRPADVEQQVLRPAAADLARIGMTLSFDWVRAPNRSVKALALRLTDPALAKPARRVRRIRPAEGPRHPPTGSPVTGLRALHPQLRVFRPQ